MRRSERGPTTPPFSDLPPAFEHLDYSRDGVLRSIEESLGRLGLDRIDVVLVHDPAPAKEWKEVKDTITTEAYAALEELRADGTVRAIGAGVDNSYKFIEMAEHGKYDCVLIAMRYNLLDHSALNDLLPFCTERNIGVFLGAPYASGLLASDPDVETDVGARHNYQRASGEVVGRARALKAVCDRHGVPLKAAALQFGIAHPAVVSTVPGARSAAEAEENAVMATLPIPADVWTEMKVEGLISAQAPVPGGTPSRGQVD